MNLRAHPSGIACLIVLLTHVGMSISSQYYQAFAGGLPAVFISRFLGLGHARGDVLPAAASSAIGLTPMVLALEGLGIAALACYFLKKGAFNRTSL